MSSPARDDDQEEEQDQPSSPAVQRQGSDSPPPKDKGKAPARSDDEEGEGSGDEEEPRRKKADDDDDEDDEEEDSEEEEERGAARGQKRPQKKQKRNRFIDIEAEVDDEDEDLDEDEDDYIKENDGFIEHFAGDDEPGVDARQVERRNQAFDRRRNENMQEDAEKIARDLQERYSRAQGARFKGDVDQVPQRLLMPSVEDPNLWQVKCKIGREKDIIFSIMRKSMDLEYAGQPLSVYSAFQRDSLPGMLYIEARSMAHVEQAIRGLVGIYISSGITLVPIEDMSALLKIKKNVVEIIPGSWVRIKRGKYQGDLAQVLDITENGEEVGLKFIPRIDYNPKDDAQEKKRKKGLSSAASALAGRPPLKFFSADEVSRAYGGRSVVKRGSSHVFQGDTFKNGFIEKDFKITGISTENVDPTLEEVTRFSGENADDDQDYTAIAEARAKAALTVLQPGDHVEVYEGEQAGLLGTVDSITGEIVRIRASHGGLQGQTIDVQGRSVRKNFKPGDHVKVMAGKSQNETGLVVSVAENIVTFLSDLSQQEVTVFSKDLREASEVGNGSNKVGSYELHDLVQLDVKTIGVIFRTEQNAFRVLDQTGSVKTVQPHQISQKIYTERNVAVDPQGVQISKDDKIVELDGERRSGTILHVWKSSFIFLFNQDLAENNGVFVLRNRAISADTGKNRASLDTTKLMPSIAGASTQQSAFGGGGGSMQISRTRDPLIDCPVVIIKGINKSLVGIIKDVNGHMCRIELQSGNKTVQINKTSLMRKDPKTGATTPLPTSMGPPPLPHGRSDALTVSNNPYAQGPAPGMTPNPYANAVGRTPNPYADAGGRTPAFAAGRTPNPYGGATPGGVWHAGSATPHLAGGRTPAYGGAQGRTPNPYGGATPGGAWNPEGSGRTPAWSSRTPAGAGASSSRTPAGAGGSAWNSTATPAGAGSSAYKDDAPGPSYAPQQNGYNNPNNYAAVSAPTPYGNPAASAPTPYGGAASAPTPYGSAPTPGAGYGSAPTPGVGGGAPTPYGSAPTPGAGYGAPTPYGGPTPVAYGSAPTPGYGAPTPAYGAPTPAYGAPTPAYGAASNQNGSGGYQDQGPGLAPDWLVGFSNLILRIVPSGSGGEYSRGKYNGDTGMLRSSNNGRALVRIKGEDMNIPFEYLVPVQPEEMGQRVLGIKGQWRGYEMTTVYRDDEQWQVEVRGEKQVLYAKELCRIAG